MASTPEDVSSAAGESVFEVESEDGEFNSSEVLDDSHPSVFHELHATTVHAANLCRELEACSEGLRSRLEASEKENARLHGMVLLSNKNFNKESMGLHERIEGLERKLGEAALREKQLRQKQDAAIDDLQASEFSRLAKAVKEREDSYEKCKEICLEWKAYAERLEMEQNESSSTKVETGQVTVVKDTSQVKKRKGSGKAKTRKAGKKGSAQDSLRKALQEERERETALHIGKFEAQKVKANSQASRIIELESMIKRLTNVDSCYKRYYNAGPARVFSSFRMSTDPKPDPVKVEIEKLRAMIDAQNDTIGQYAKREAELKITVAQQERQLGKEDSEDEGKAPEQVDGFQRDEKESDEGDSGYVQRSWIQRRGKWVPH